MAAEVWFQWNFRSSGVLSPAMRPRTTTVYLACGIARLHADVSGLRIRWLQTGRYLARESSIVCSGKSTESQVLPPLLTN